MLNHAYRAGAAKARDDLAKQGSVPYYLANAAAGGLGGYLMTNSKKDRLRNALLGTVLGGLGGAAARHGSAGSLGLIPGVALGAVGVGLSEHA